MKGMNRLENLADRNRDNYEKYFRQGKTEVCKEITANIEMIEFCMQVLKNPAGKYNYLNNQKD